MLQTQWDWLNETQIYFMCQSMGLPFAYQVSSASAAFWNTSQSSISIEYTYLNLEMIFAAVIVDVIGSIR